jgi:hypothetical protein
MGWVTKTWGRWLLLMLLRLINHSRMWRPLGVRT